MVNFNRELVSQNQHLKNFLALFPSLKILNGKTIKTKNFISLPLHSQYYWIRKSHLELCGISVCYTQKSLFAALYVISFVCDALDGWFARKFNQVSTFGAVLDMVTDRVSTACLLAVLSQLYRPGLIFLALLALDIGSHSLQQMYSSFLSGKASHKDVKDS